METIFHQRKIFVRTLTRMIELETIRRTLTGKHYNKALRLASQRHPQLQRRAQHQQ